jgi:hypothetical protein
MKYLKYCLYLITLLLPLSLLLNPNGVFYPPADWNNNLWIIGYTGNILKSHFYFPNVFSASNAVGVATPMFYGYLIYPALGLLSAFVGADLAVHVDKPAWYTTNIIAFPFNRF